MEFSSTSNESSLATLDYERRDSSNVLMIGPVLWLYWPDHQTSVGGTFSVSSFISRNSYTRPSAKEPASRQGPICQVCQISGFDANRGEPKGVELGISYIANYKDGLNKMLLKFCQKAANSLTNGEKSISLHTFQLNFSGSRIKMRDY